MKIWWSITIRSAIIRKAHIVVFDAEDHQRLAIVPLGDDERHGILPRRGAADDPDGTARSVGRLDLDIVERFQSFSHLGEQERRRSVAIGAPFAADFE